MNKIWFSIAMTFNTSLFVSLILLVVLPNAKYVSTKRTTPKYNSGEKAANNLRNPKTISITTNPMITTEEDSEILGYGGDDYDYKDAQDEDDEKDVLVKSAMNPLNTTENTNSSDYDLTVNPAEKLATEAPEMDTQAELVDENGQVEIVDEDETEEDETNDTTTSMTTTTSQKTTNSVPNRFGKRKKAELTKVTAHIPTPKHNTTTPKPRKFSDYLKMEALKAELLKSFNYTLPHNFDIKSKLYQLYQQKLSERNATQLALKRLCLEHTQDSGYWCEGEVSRLKIKYFYQKDTQSCECFLYYGCLGNNNNFNSVKECEDKCKNFGLKKHNTNPPSSKFCSIVP